MQKEGYSKRSENLGEDGEVENDDAEPIVLRLIYREEQHHQHQNELGVGMRSSVYKNLGKSCTIDTKVERDSAAGMPRRVMRHPCAIRYNSKKSASASQIRDENE